MSPDSNFIFRNSTILPATERPASFDKEVTVREMYNWARDAFDLKRGAFILFLRSGKKWYKLEPTRKLSRYPLDKETMRVSVKKHVPLDKIKEIIS
ncbi:MAG: hypothetical protein ACXABK_05590 [Candidatus Heimdallarchaeaceae archaeon]|jgi:hypothetical protein